MESKLGYFLLPLAILMTGCPAGGSPSPKASPSPSPTPSSSSSSPSPTPSINLGNADIFTGPYSTIEAEYQMPAGIDPDVLAGVNTQEKGAVFAPATLPNSALPIIILLHGNHDTCGTNTTPIVQTNNQYTFQGNCAGTDVEIPSYHGYDYLATRLASFGNIVVSIDANLGITAGNSVTGDSGLILARGRLVLRTLAMLSQWNKGTTPTPASLGMNLTGKLDFTQVGLFGHSRGGEGVRAAYNLYKNDPNVSTPWVAQILNPMTVRGIFEVGPVDGQSSMTLNATGAAWNVLLPTCDGDVTGLQGMKPYDRMLQNTAESPALPKSMYAVWGANHDFYNTEWQNSESTGCVGTTPIWDNLGANISGSANEQETAIGSVIPFFRAHVGVGADPTLAVSFSPMYPLIPEVSAITRVDRTYVSSPNNNYSTHLETFANGSTLGSQGHPFVASNLTFSIGNVGILEPVPSPSPVYEHDPSLKAAEIVWTSGGSSTYFQDNWTATPQGISVSSDVTLDFRVSRNNSSLNPSTATDFEIQLVFSDGTLGTAVHVSSYLSLVGPIGGSGSTSPNPQTYLHATLPSVKIPLSALGVGTRQVSGVRFTFNGTSSGDIFISSIDVSASGTVGNASIQPEQNVGEVTAEAIEAAQGMKARFLLMTPKPSNRVGVVKRSSDNSGDVEIEIQSDTVFPVRDALPVLHMNGKTVSTLGSFDPSGDLHSMSFRVKSGDMSDLPDSFQMDVGYREDPSGSIRSVGVVQKGALQP